MNTLFLQNKGFVLQNKGFVPRFLGLVGITLLGFGNHLGVALADGNPDVVGILASITRTEVASELGLTPDQLDRLKALVKQQENQSLNLALRELSPAERAAKMFAFVRGTEKMGYSILNSEQAAKVEQMRLRQLGLVALMDPEVGSLVGVTDAQVAKMQTILEGKKVLTKEFGAIKATAEVNKRMDGVLNDDQRAAWIALTGLTMNAETGEQTPVEETGPTADAVARAATPKKGPNDALMISFNAATWSDVLKWIASQAELSLQIDVYPTGTFTYRDPYKTYSVSEAMNIMNSVLIGKGYALLRKERVLMCIDLGSGESADVIKALIRELAELVPVEELDERGTFELAKTVFALQRLSVEEMEKELKSLVGGPGSVVPLTSSGQLLITETVGKLRLIRDAIKKAENPESGRASKIVKIDLHHVSADEVLGIARPLLGMKDGGNTSEDLSVSTDTFGNTLFATGSNDKLMKLKDLVTQIDIKPSETNSVVTVTEQPIIRRHSLVGSDPTTTMDIMQSQFAGQTNIKLTIDPKTNNIIAQATPSDHKIIDALIAEVAGQTSDFEIIQLDKMDTQAAMLTLERFYGKQSKDKDPSTIKGPLFSADATLRRIMVKGTKDEIEQVRRLLGKIEENGPNVSGLGESVRTLPYTGRSADRYLNQMDLLWQATKRTSRIRVLESKQLREKKARRNDSMNRGPFYELPEEETDSIDEADAPAKDRAKPPKSNRDARNKKSSPSNPIVKFASANPLSGDEPPTKNADNKQGDKAMDSEITIVRSPNGLVVSSDNPQALSEFDEVSRMVQDSLASGPSEPTVIHLEFITAAAAAELIKNIIAGESASGGGGSLLGDVASNVIGGGGLFGGLLGMGGSNASSASGAATSGDVVITPDARLNALWVQANPMDMQLVEELVEIIDIPESPVSIKTRGMTKLIYIQNAQVTDVENTIKQLFADRISQAGTPGAAAQPSPQDFIDALRGGGNNRRGSGKSELKEQTMSVSADKKNNALIVIAPPSLIAEVESIVKQMDDAAAGVEESVVVYSLGGDVNATIVQNALASMFGSSAKTSSTTNTPNPASQVSQNGQPPGGNPANFMNQFPRGGGFPGMGGQGRGGAPGGFPGGGFPGGFPGFGGPAAGQGGQGPGQAGQRGTGGGGQRGNRGAGR